MSAFGTIILIWFAVSLPASIAMGKFLKWRNGQ